MIFLSILGMKKNNIRYAVYWKLAYDLRKNTQKEYCVLKEVDL